MSDDCKHYSCGCREVPTPMGYGMIFCDKHTPIRENRKRKKKRRGQVLSAFESEHYYYILYDSRETDNNNFTLKILLKSNKKIISIMGVDNILDKLNKDNNIERKDYLEVEKHLLEGVI